MDPVFCFHFRFQRMRRGPRKIYVSGRSRFCCFLFVVMFGRESFKRGPEAGITTKRCLSLPKKGHQHGSLTRKKRKVEDWVEERFSSPRKGYDDAKLNNLSKEEITAVMTLLKLPVFVSFKCKAKSTTPKSTPRFQPKRYPWELLGNRRRKLSRRQLFFCKDSFLDDRSGSCSPLRDVSDEGHLLFPSPTNDSAVSFAGTADSTSSACILKSNTEVSNEVVPGRPLFLLLHDDSAVSFAGTQDSTGSACVLQCNTEVSNEVVPARSLFLPLHDDFAVSFAGTADSTGSNSMLQSNTEVSNEVELNQLFVPLHDIDGNAPENTSEELGASMRSVGVQCDKCTGTRSIGIQCQMPTFNYDRCKNMSEKDFRFFTGVTQKTFEVLYAFIGGDKLCYHLKYANSDGTPRRPLRSSLSPRDRFFMTLVRLRRGVPIRDLAVVFNISTGYASSIVYTWIRFLSIRFKPLLARMFTPAAAQNANKPDIFDKWPNLRAVIDCFHLRFQKPFNFQMQSNTYSVYKAGNDLKYLVAMSAMGTLCFLSKGYEGSMSDKEIVIRSGFLDLLKPNETVMCDRGFDIEAELNAIDVNIAIPPFLGTRQSFTAAEVELSKEIAEGRIFVEILIKRIKDFRILRGTIPNKLLPVTDDMVLICAVLSQFDPPFISKGKIITEEDEDEE